MWRLTAESRLAVRTATLTAPAAVFMLMVFALPLASVVFQSVRTEDGSHFSLDAYAKLFATPLFWRVASTTIEISAGATLLSFLLAYPVAYFLARQSPRARALFMILVLIPFWTSTLVKSYSLIVILGQSGLINQFFGLFGLAPVKMLFNRIGVMIGMSQFLIPFMIFPILVSLLNQPPALARAAAIMGAGKIRIFFRVTFPLSLPGVVAGGLLVFILSLGFYIVPALLGGRQDLMLANLVDFYAREILNWPMSSSVAMVLIAAAIFVALLLSKVRGGASILSDESH